MREISISQDPGVLPESWRVEDIDCDGDGGCSVIVFSGAFAEQRARRYADRLQTNTD